MKRRFDLYFNDILESISRINKYVDKMDFEEFSKKDIIVDAVLRNLEIIGEAVTQLPREIKEKYNYIHWRDIQDFRIVVAHHYWKINMDRIWDIVQNKLLSLQKNVREILEKEEK